MEKIKLIANQLIELSASEATELLEIFKDEYNIEPVVNTIIGSESVEIKIKDLEIKTSFDIVLEDPGPQRIKVVKLIKEITTLGLRESKQLMDDSPSIILQDIPKDKANELKEKFVELGAIMILK